MEGRGNAVDERTAFLERQRACLEREFSNLVERENGEREAFLALAGATFDELAERLGPSWRRPHCLPLSPETGSFPLQKPGTAAALNAGLRRQWKAWILEFDLLLARNPRLELARHLQAISESHDRSSWPNESYDGALQDWLDKGLWFEPPFDDRDGILTEAFYARLRLLRKRIGGWLLLRGDRVVFLMENEWQEERRRRGRRRADRQREMASPADGSGTD